MITILSVNHVRSDFMNSVSVSTIILCLDVCHYLTFIWGISAREINWHCNVFQGLPEVGDSWWPVLGSRATAPSPMLETRVPWCAHVAVTTCLNVRRTARGLTCPGVSSTSLVLRSRWPGCVLAFLATAHWTCQELSASLLVQSELPSGLSDK